MESSGSHNHLQPKQSSSRSTNGKKRGKLIINGWVHVAELCLNTSVLDSIPDLDFIQQHYLLQARHHLGSAAGAGASDVDKTHAEVLHLDGKVLPP